MRTRTWRSGPAGGEIRASTRPNEGPNETFEYREGGHALSICWEPREQGNDIWHPFDEWDVPPGESLDDAARTRVLDGLWDLSCEVGIDAIYRWSKNLKAAVIVRWKKGDDGFLVCLYETGELTYMELGRTVSLRCEPAGADDRSAVVSWPPPALWTEPVRPIGVAEVERIRLHLTTAAPQDYRRGAELGWHLVVAGYREANP